MDISFSLEHFFISVAIFTQVASAPLSCQPNRFPFSKQLNPDLSFLNSGFRNFKLSSDANIFPGQDLKSLFTECNSIQTPFKDSDHLVTIDSKYHDINDFNKLKSNENSSLSQHSILILLFYQNILKICNFLSMLKHLFHAIDISEHKINKKLINANFNLLGYIFCFNETESPHIGTSFLNLTN